MITHDPKLFQSTLPLRGATIFARSTDEVEEISIHAPLTGSDLRKMELEEQIEISIHAPLTGSDSPCPSHSRRAPHFNPRSPYGERRIWSRSSSTSSSFQSTLPLRGATPRPRRLAGATPYFNPRSPYGERRGLHALLLGGVEFQSTLPLRGATLLLPLTAARSSIFQSTLPLRGATFGIEDVAAALYISIHAPLTGSDLTRNQLLLDYPDFNPRSPYGERLCTLIWARQRALFQSTLPLRGATLPTVSLFFGTVHFNPRSPYGERPSRPAG